MAGYGGDQLKVTNMEGERSGDTTAFFPTLYKYIHRQYFFIIFLHDYRSGVQFVQVTICAINTMEHWGGLLEEVSTTHIFRP